MKRTFLVLLVSLIALGLARADQFRIKTVRGDKTSDASYATVRIQTGGRDRFQGKTDKYGRITINLPKGRYEAQVQADSDKFTVPLAIDGDTKLKEVSVKR